MTQKLIDLLNNILKFNNMEIIVVFDEKEKPWFSAVQVAKIIGYVKTKEAIRENVSEKHRSRLDELVDDPSQINKNAQPHAIYIDEPGLYKLMMTSRKESAVQFQDWILDEVIPKIREFGQYHISEKYKKELDQIKDKLNALKNNQKKNKFPLGGHIYVVRPINGDKNLLKVGKTEKLSPRMNTYNTSVPDNMEVLYTIKVDNPTAVEYCMKGLLHDYRYRDNKEYYECSLEYITDVITKCDKIIGGNFYCEKCKSEIDDTELSRHISEENNISKTEDAIYGVIYDNKQEGGMHDDADLFEFKYLKYKAKYLELVLDKMK